MLGGSAETGNKEGVLRGVFLVLVGGLRGDFCWFCEGRFR